LRKAKQNLAFEKSKVKVLFISLYAKYGFCEKQSKSYFLAFEKSIVKVFFISLFAQRNETKKCAGSYAAGPLCRIKRQILYMNLQK